MDIPRKKQPYSLHIRFSVFEPSKRLFMFLFTPMNYRRACLLIFISVSFKTFTNKWNSNKNSGPVYDLTDIHEIRGSL